MYFWDYYEYCMLQTTDNNNKNNSINKEYYALNRSDFDA